MEIMTEIKEEIKEKDGEFGISLDEMTKAGLYFGHKASKIHPKMKPYISGIKNDIHMIDLDKTAKGLEEALAFVKKTIENGKIILLVGTKIQTKKMVEEFGREMGVPYVSARWLGGTFTNFDTIKKRVFYFKDLEKKKQIGELEKYTKKERAKMDKELRDLETKIGGIKNMEKLLFFSIDFCLNCESHPEVLFSAFKVKTRNFESVLCKKAS